MDIMEMVQSGAQFKVELSIYDLMKFAEQLVKKSMDEQRVLDAARQSQLDQQTGGKEVYLTAQETAAMCNVCLSTLYAWSKTGYLVPCKIGRAKRYALSDINRLLSAHSADESKLKPGVMPTPKSRLEKARLAANAGLGNDAR